VEPITWVFVAAAAVVVFAIAAGVVGREAHRLDAVAPRSVYMIDEVVEFVAEYLPVETQAHLTPDELEQLLTFHMRWLHAKGLQPTNVVDRRQDIDTLVIVGEDDLVAYLLAQAEEHGIDIVDDVDVVNVVDAHLAYFEAIGAVGPKAVDLE
jgi:cytochrome b